MKKLYKHQKKQNKELIKALKVEDHVLYGAATGFGKSVALQHLVAKDLKKNLRVLVLAPFRKLIFQLEQTFAIQQPHVIMGTIDRGSKSSGLVLSSMDTMNNRLSKGSIYFEGFDKIYIDEAHISCSFPPKASSRLLLLYNKYWNTAKWIGFTATPITGTGYRLEGWDKTIYRYQTGDLIDKGFLADYTYSAPVNLDISSLKVNRMGDFVAEDIESVTNTPSAVKSIKKVWKEHGKNKRKVLIFASSINHAELLQEAIKGSYVIHSNISEKEQNRVLDNFKFSKVGTLINVNMLVAGFDDPTIDMLIIGRPIKSLRTYMQVVGRALRKHGDKIAHIYDMCSCHETCGLPREIRDFNRIKGEVIKKEETDLVDVLSKRCAICDAVSPVSEYSVKKTVGKKSILTEYTCPVCGNLCDEKREDLIIVDEVKIIEERKITKLSFQERKDIVGDYVEEFTSARRSWSHFIVQDINVTGRTNLLLQILSKDIKPKTKWKNIMDLYSDAKREVNNA